MNKSRQPSEVTLYIEELVLEGLPPGTDITPALELELSRLLSAPEMLTQLMQSSPDRHQIARLDGGRLPGRHANASSSALGAAVGQSVGRALRGALSESPSGNPLAIPNTAEVRR